MRSPHVSVVVDLNSIRAAAMRIRSETGRPLIAVLKSDAYGLGATEVGMQLEGIAQEFAYFSFDEAKLFGRPGLVIGPVFESPQEYRSLGVRPAISNRYDAQNYCQIQNAILLNTGMNGLGCAPDQLSELLAISCSTEVFTHTESMIGVNALLSAISGRFVSKAHAAASALLSFPDAALDAVRPGIAMYRGSVRVSTSLHSVRELHGPFGYMKATEPRVGTILAGYSNNLQPASILINGKLQRILEVGMNTSFVSVSSKDKPGNEVVLMGGELSEQALARELVLLSHKVAVCRCMTVLALRIWCLEVS